MSHIGSYNYGGEKVAVVFDIGYAYTKCGFAGENGPRAIIPSEIKSRSDGKVKSVLGNYEDPENRHMLSDFFYHMYFRHLLVNPKERRVVIIESILTPSRVRNTIAEVLFKSYEVPSVLFAPSHLVAILTLGIQSALVVDVGYKETAVLPIFEGTPLLKGWEALPLAGKAIHDYLEAQLLELCTITSQDGDKPVSSIYNKLDPKVLENIKVRCCFITNLERAKKIQNVQQGKAEKSEAPTPPPSVDYPIDGDKILHINGEIRENTGEVLFEQDNEQTSVATIILDSILKCPIDVRRILAENIVLMGGTCMLRGFNHRLHSELLELVQLEKYNSFMKTWNFKFHQPPSSPNYTAWLGGGIFGALEILGSRSLTRESYNKNSILPDWCSLYTPEEEKLTTPLKR